MFDATLLLYAGATGLGLVLSFLAWRRRGLTAGVRGAAWSLLPISAYLLGAHSLLWGIADSVVKFVTGLLAGIFNPLVWAGVILGGLSVVLFVVSGVLRSRGVGGAKKKQPKVKPSKAAAAPAGQQPAAAAPAANPAVAAPKKQTNDDDFSDIEEILKRRGIG